MSKRNKKNLNETVNTENEVIVDGEVEETEMKEKKNVFTIIGEAAGKTVNTVGKVVKSKPAKVVGAIAGAGLLIAAGYKAGKDGIPSIGEESDDSDMTETDSASVDVTEDQAE